MSVMSSYFSKLDVFTQKKWIDMTHTIFLEAFNKSGNIISTEKVNNSTHQLPLSSYLWFNTVMFGQLYICVGDSLNICDKYELNLHIFSKRRLSVADHNSHWFSFLFILSKHSRMDT